MTTQGVNDTRLKDLYATAFALGKDEGEGKNARPLFAMKVFLAAADGVIVPAKGDDDPAKPLFAKYIAGVAKDYAFKGHADTNENSIKANTSKLRNFIVVGGMPFFLKARDNGTSTVAVKFVELCDERLQRLASVSDKSVPIYDKQVSIMRAQKAKVKAGIHEPLTSEEIDAAIATKPSNPEELKMVRQVLGRLRKLAEDPLCAGSAEYLIAAAKALAPRVHMLEQEEEDAELAEQVSSLTPEQKARLVTKLAA